MASQIPWPGSGKEKYCSVSFSLAAYFSYCRATLIDLLRNLQNQAELVVIWVYFGL